MMSNRVLGSACVALAVTVVAGCTSAGPTIPGSVRSSAALPAAHTVSGPRVGDDAAYTLDLLDGASTVEIVTANLGGRLYRVQTVPGSPVLPNAQLVSHTVNLTLRGGGDADLRIVLDRSVPWQLRFSAGASTVTADMSAGRLEGLDALQGISTLDVTAGRPAGPVTLSEAAGISTFALHVPASSPVTVQCHAGAGTVALFGQTHQGIAAGSTFTTHAAASARYVIDAQAGISTVTVDAQGSASQ
jgi:hypothetical protein